MLNQGHQKLYGNLGYRVIEANIRELLREPGAGEMSWCWAAHSCVEKSYQRMTHDYAKKQPAEAI